jgi:thioredoxin reductase (NADPH)
VVYITPNPDLARGLNPNIPVILEKPVRIIGEDRVEGVATEKRLIPVHGVFVFRDAVTYNTLISGVHLEHQFIQVSRHMETNIEGLYAAGDCTGKPFQIAKAVGEGNIAAIAAAECLDWRLGQV